MSAMARARGFKINSPAVDDRARGTIGEPSRPADLSADDLRPYRGDKRMKHRKALIVVLFLVASQIAVGLVSSRTAGASVGPADDRQQTAVTAWWTYTGVS